MTDRRRPHKKHTRNTIDGKENQNRYFTPYKLLLFGGRRNATNLNPHYQSRLILESKQVFNHHGRLSNFANITKRKTKPQIAFLFLLRIWLHCNKLLSLRLVSQTHCYEQGCTRQNNIVNPKVFRHSAFSNMPT